MSMHSNLSLDLVNVIHQGRIAEAERWRQVAMARRARRERAAHSADQPPASTAEPRGRFHRADLADWLVRVGDIVARYPAEELDGPRRRALTAVVDGLLDAAREGGADVSLAVESDDAAVVLARTLGRLAASTAGRSVPVSRRRARSLEAALDELVRGGVAQRVKPRADRAA